MRPAHLADVRPSDLAIAAAVALVALTATTLAISVAHLRRRADAPIIDPGIGVPIRVKPVLDVPAGSSAGGRGEASLPPEWARPDPPPEASADAVAPPDAPRVPRRRRPRPSDPKAPSQVEPGEAPAGEATTGAGEGPGGETEAGDGPVGDPLGARAIAAYRERLIRWLSVRFQVRGSGLSQSDLARHRARVEIEVSEAGIVTHYTILGADHPAFEEAARAALEAVQGELVPPPPEFYPGALQRRLRVTFVCTESTCD